MAAKPKPKHYDTDTWIVTKADDTPIEVTAESLEISETGLLTFSTDDVTVRAFAAGHWTELELKAPVAEEPAQA